MAFAGTAAPGFTADELAGEMESGYDGALARDAEFMTHPNFHRYRSETQMLRYLKKLENRDLSLAHSMIPLGICTMKLNAAAEMIPVTFRGFSKLHPFAPLAQATGYHEMMDELRDWLKEITGFSAVSLQPNSRRAGRARRAHDDPRLPPRTTATPTARSASSRRRRTARTPRAR